MSEVLFGQSYYLRFDPKLWAAMQPYPPLGTLYAASYVRDAATTWRCSTHAGRVRGRVGRRARRAPAALRGHLRGQLQLPVQDVPARMREAAFAMIAMAAKARGCNVIVSGSDATDHAGKYSPPAPTPSCSARARRRWRELLDCLTGQAGRRPGDGRRRVARPAAPRPDAERDLIRDARRAALPGLGPGRHRALQERLVRPPRLLLDEHGDHARLPVPLQLVRQADLGSALQRAHRPRTWPRNCAGSRTTSSPTTSGSPTTSSGLKPGLDRAVRDEIERLDARDTVQVPAARAT